MPDRDAGEPVAAEGGAGLRRGASAARRRWSSYFLMAASANNLARAGDMGLWMKR